MRDENAKDIALGVFAVSQPADTGNLHFRDHLLAAVGSDLCDCFFNGVDLDRIDGARLGVHVLHQATVDARLRIRAGDGDVILGWAAPLVDLPTENFAVKLGGTLRLNAAEFEMYDTVHEFSP